MIIDTSRLVLSKIIRHDIGTLHDRCVGGAAANPAMLGTHHCQFNRNNRLARSALRCHNGLFPGRPLFQPNNEFR